MPEGIDLSPYVPSEARSLQNSYPDVRSEYNIISAVDEGYDGRSGNVANLVNGHNGVVDLEDGSYNWNSTVFGNTVTGVIGDGAICYHTGVNTSHFFGGTSSTWVIEGVTFDITGDPGGGLDTDIGLASIDTTNEGWFRDVHFHGQRHLNQDYNNSGSVGPPPNASRRMTFLVEAVNSGATNYMENVNFPDGGTDEADTVGTVGHAIGPNADPSHSGLNVWYQCHAEGFMDNGFYVNNSPGPNILWDCTARNNAAGNMRLGDRDVVIGGYSEITHLPNQRNGQPLSIAGGRDIHVIGIELYADSPRMSDAGIQIRDSGSGDNINLVIEEVILHMENGHAPVRISSNRGVLMRRCYILDTSSSGSSTIRCLNGDGVGEGEELYVHSDNYNELYTHRSGDRFTYEGTTYSGAGNSWSASQVGFLDPRPLPEHYWGTDTSREYDAVFKVTDAETGNDISGASVRITVDGTDHTGTTNANGRVNLGSFPQGQYAYRITHSSYDTRTGTYGNNTNSAQTVQLNPSPETDIINVRAETTGGTGIDGVTVRLFEQ